MIWLAAVAACHAPTASPSPIEARREVFLAYQLGALRVEGAPPIEPAIARELARFEAVRAARLVDVSGDGTHVLAFVDGGLVELDAPHARPVDRSDGRDVEWARYGAGRAFAYTSDRDGDEHGELHDSSGKTYASALAIADPIWDRSRRRLVFGARDDRMTDLMMIDTEHEGSWRRHGDGAIWGPLDMSIDGHAILARREVSSTESTVYRIDVATQVATPLTALSGASATLARFGNAGELYVVTDEDRDRLGLWCLTPRSRARLAPELLGDVTAFAVSGDGGTIALVTAEEGTSSLHVLDAATGEHHPLAVPSGVIGDLRFAASAPVIGFSLGDATHPRGIYTYDLRAGTLVRWSDGDADQVAVAPRAAVVMARDGVRVPVLVYHPATRAPVVIDLHGGPEDQWLPRYEPFVQLLVARGYAVVQPNVRGSAGYGRAFLRLDDGAHREDAVRDVGAVLDWIATQPDLDAGRVVVMGTSYGGYLALASLLAYSERLRGGITLGAITDLPAFLAGTAGYRRDHRRAEYGDERDPPTRAFLERISPLAHASELRRPLLVAQGGRDPRVPPANAEQLVTRARAAGVAVWSLAASDEGHLFAHADNREAFEVLAVQFLDGLSN